MPLLCFLYKPGVWLSIRARNLRIYSLWKTEYIQRAEKFLRGLPHGQMEMKIKEREIFPRE